MCSFGTPEISVICSFEIPDFQEERLIIQSVNFLLLQLQKLVGVNVWSCIALSFLICFGNLVANPVLLFISNIAALRFSFVIKICRWFVCAFSSYCAFCNTFICMLYIMVLLDERQVSHFYIVKEACFVCSQIIITALSLYRNMLTEGW